MWGTALLGVRPSGCMGASSRMWGNPQGCLGPVLSVGSIPSRGGTVTVNSVLLML